MCFNITIDWGLYNLWIINARYLNVPEEYLQYLHFGSIKYTSVYRICIFSTADAQLKCIKYKIYRSNLADFKYTSLVY